ncbi:hypothetical protein AVEN_237296-1 [Araneus ventricosus]|uniref:DUF4817 domain-containing protein n=1 Tax=Araneus ventricosus TaxID=182803 RepID=A0A4Y2DKI5_ARAVE|nr:hypothetical protein AVEN_237296-1 [Araneus ventricosus]
MLQMFFRPEDVWCVFTTDNLNSSFYSRKSHGHIQKHFLSLASCIVTEQHNSTIYNCNEAHSHLYASCSTTDIAAAVQRLLRSTFREHRVTTRSCPHPWPPRFSNLKP